jgi:hypothetical protein
MHPVTVVNLVAGERNRIDVFFSTSTVTPFPLQSVGGFAAGNQSVGFMPASITRPGDLHTLDASAKSSDGTTYRGDRQFFLMASDRAAALADPLVTPEVTQIGAAARLHVALDRQATYPSFVNVRLDQRSPALHRVTLVVTSGYAGASGAWEVEMPDFAAIDGFPAAAAFVTGTDVTWTVEAYDGPPMALLGAPVDGAHLRYAGATGTLTL